MKDKSGQVISQAVNWYANSPRNSWRDIEEIKELGKRWAEVPRSHRKAGENEEFVRVIRSLRNCSRTIPLNKIHIGIDYKSFTTPKALIQRFPLLGAARWIGVEIEGIVTNGEWEKLFEDPFFRQYWCSIGTDGSIHGGPENKGFEVRFFLKYGNWKRIENVCAKLEIYGARVNSSCGLHVHLDASPFSNEWLPARRLVSALGWLTLLIHPTRLHNTYCRDNRYTTTRGRYKMINRCAVRRHGTTEVRCHHGTLNAEEITEWVKIISWVQVNRQKNTTLRDVLSAKCKMPDDSKEYIRVCAKHWNPQLFGEDGNLKPEPADPVVKEQPPDVQTTQGVLRWVGTQYVTVVS